MVPLSECDIRYPCATADQTEKLEIDYYKHHLGKKISTEERLNKDPGSIKAIQPGHPIISRFGAPEKEGGQLVSVQPGRKGLLPTHLDKTAAIILVRV